MNKGKSWLQIGPPGLLGGFVLGLVARCSGLAPLRDKAFFGYYYALAAYDAPTAAARANGISQPGPREAAMKAVFKQWSRYDEPAARNFILQATGLTPTARLRILQ
jgi:hypothetical protein